MADRAGWTNVGCFAACICSGFGVSYLRHALEMEEVGVSRSA